ncbi:hypothetical protein GKA01_17350 [Gluconobacter kanchanaburiensis NBRC 103587]|uniref:Uncharacterized protein n=2 Tax=Gluconobacter kanchanaburiensis TaxID=563199 RepID=A0A511B804_9PROT|nr:hypothetical protein [Gluconobacter kanchanaburiensis]GBR71370.1 hypothetical protein AA103587_2367 [Gluconobacter kanchanaburiensis NBRC 103587]GEK96538.1 hypothetical protein GKA01_17350 [Gluconobacter kanchanaburiensis NBRC 103587]
MAQYLPPTSRRTTALLAPVLMLGACVSGQETNMTRGHTRQSPSAYTSRTFPGEPDFSSATHGNLAGALHYCLRSAALTKDEAVHLQPVDQVGTDYSAGRQGILQVLNAQTGQHEQYALPSMPQPARRAVCTSVATRIRQFQPEQRFPVSTSGL